MTAPRKTGGIPHRAGCRSAARPPKARHAEAQPAAKATHGKADVAVVIPAEIDVFDEPDIDRRRAAAGHRAAQALADLPACSSAHSAFWSRWPSASGPTS